MIGENIRQARLAQQLSLADVAKRAKISIATLSRIENEKQTLELGLFLTLARILERSPHELLGDLEEGSGTSIDPLVKKVVAFEASERAKFWRELATARRLQRAKSRLRIHQLAHYFEDLLAQVELLREELDNVRKRLRRPPR